MKNYLPILMASVLLIFGAGTLLINEMNKERNPAGFRYFASDAEAKEVIKEESDRAVNLEEKLNETTLRIATRFDATRKLVIGKMSLLATVELYNDLNRLAHDPTHPEDGWVSEFERYHWISRQIRMNIVHVVLPAEKKQLLPRVLAELNALDWVLADM